MKSTRRRFLRLLGIGAAAATTAVVVPKVATTAKPTTYPTYRVNIPGPYENARGERYVYIKTDRAVRAGELIMSDDVLVGMMCFDTAKGDYGFVQTSGAAIVRCDI